MLCPWVIRGWELAQKVGCLCIKENFSWKKWDGWSMRRKLPEEEDRTFLYPKILSRKPLIALPENRRVWTREHQWIA
jgi:hypothetical protein